MNRNKQKPAAPSERISVRIAELYDGTFTRIYNSVRYRVEDAAAAEELTADVYERAIVSFDHYCPEQGPLEAWLFGIVHHVVGDYLRRRRLIAWLSLEALRGQHAPDPSPEEICIQNSLEDELLQVLPKLKDRERELLGLKYGGGLTNRQIASLVGLTEQNVGVILYRAVKRLRQLMNGYQVNNYSPRMKEVRNE